ncbi:MAG: UbiX family flavin prenyltransferase [Desulfobacteraceae bacterium]
MSDRENRYIVAMTGASGAIYGLRLARALVKSRCRVYLIVSSAARKVLHYEAGLASYSSMPEFLTAQGIDCKEGGRVELLDPDDIAACVASGSFVHAGMAVAPCSMKTLAGIASGNADNLVTRAADVALKETRKLILLCRETPLNLIHLDNMGTAARAGAVIMPACPSFYGAPLTIEDLADSVVSRALDHLGVENGAAVRWDPSSD